MNLFKKIQSKGAAALQRGNVFKKLIILIALLALSIPIQVQSIDTTRVKSYREFTNYNDSTVSQADATAIAIDSSKYKQLYSLKLDWIKRQASNESHKVVGRVPNGLVENKITENGNKIIMYRERIPIEVDYDRGVLISQGREIPITVDGDARIMSRAEMDSITWVHLPYNRFDVYIDSVFYYNNTPAIDDFFDKFEPRFALLESLTDWSSEKFYGKKLEIYVEGGPCCSCGWALPAEFHLTLYRNLSNPNVCNIPYYENGVPYLGNPGELGDQWRYMSGALHEALHAINPYPIIARSWLTEGWSEYYSLNILSMYYGNQYPDINQETANYYLYHGWATPEYWNWEGYVANDYRDTENNYPIQESAGYDITAWMFSMLRDNYSLNWNNFYSILNNNLETLDKSQEIGGGTWYSYYTDTHIIDVFGRACGMNFSQIKNIFEYDPSGITPPIGWGVRNWTDLNWYADLTPNLAVSDTIPPTGDSIQLNATVHNTGAVSLNDVVVRFYTDTNLIKEKVVSVPESSFTIVSTKYTAPVGIYTLKVVANEGHVKIEKGYDNNTDSVKVIFLMLGDANEDGKRTVSDAVYLVNYLFKGGTAPVPVLRSGDCNCDGKVTVADVVYLINYLFKGGPPPAC